MIQPDFNIFFWGGGGERGEEGSICNEQYNCTFKSFDSDFIFLNIFSQDCRIDLVCITFFFGWSYNVSYVSSHMFLHRLNKFAETND